MATTDTSLTLTLGGEVTLPLFAQALTGLNDLLKTLGKHTGAESVEWVVESLDAGSASATFRGHGDDPEVISQTTAAVIEAATVVEHDVSSVLPLDVVAAARRLTRVLAGVVRCISISSGEEAISMMSQTGGPVDKPERVTAFGSVTGVVQTLTQARGRYFRITEDTFGRSVPGRFAADLGDSMREIWGKRAIVEGLITRDRRSGRPIAVADVRRVSLAPESLPGAFVRARGVLAISEAIEPSEVTIRRLRDAS